MARIGTGALFLLLIAGPVAAEDSLVERWDKPKRESFEMKETLPVNVAEEIRSRYGTAFEADVVGLPRMDFEAKEVTFFEALDRFAAAQKLLVVSGERGLALVRPKQVLPPTAVAYPGPTRLAVSRISVLAVTRWEPEASPERLPGDLLRGTPSGRRVERLLRAYLTDVGVEEQPRLRVGLKWIAEPGFDVALVHWSVTRVEDDAGGVLAAQQGPELPLAANHAFCVDFEAPLPKAKAIAKLEGRLRIAVPSGEGEVEFLAADAWRTKQLGDASVQLEDVDAKTTVVTFTIKGAPCEALRSDDDALDVRVGSQGKARPTALTVLAYRADGTEIAGSLKRTWSDIGSPHRTYWVQLDEAPQRIVLRSTTVAVVREAPFAFTNIALPE